MKWSGSVCLGEPLVTASQMNRVRLGGEKLKIGIRPFSFRSVLRLTPSAALEGPSIQLHLQVQRQERTQDRRPKGGVNPPRSRSGRTWPFLSGPAPRPSMPCFAS